mgnify:CR=1 FL=1
MALHIEMYWYWDQNPSTVWLRVHLCPGYRWLDTPPEGLSARPLLCKQLHPLYLACRRLTVHSRFYGSLLLLGLRIRAWI